MILKHLRGNPDGKTAWQIFREKIAEPKDTMLQCCNPLSMRVGDLLELYGSSQSFNCESILHYFSEQGATKWVRYQIKNLVSGEIFFLEAMPADNGDYYYALFHLIDEISWDDDLLGVIEGEDILRITKDNLTIDYEKDFLINCRIKKWQNGELVTLTNVISANYVRQDQEEEFLSVELIESMDCISFYEGKKIVFTDIVSYGTQKPVL